MVSLIRWRLPKLSGRTPKSRDWKPLASNGLDTFSREAQILRSDSQLTASRSCLPQSVGLPVLGLTMVLATIVAQKLGPDWDLDIKVPPFVFEMFLKDRFQIPDSDSSHKTMPVDEWLASNDPFYADIASPK